MLTLAVTYAGVLGGAERTLLDFTRGLPGGLVLACPEGALAERARRDGVNVVPLRSRPLELRGGIGERVGAGRALAGHARDARRLVQEVRPDLLVAWGMRSAIVAPAAAASFERRPAVVARHVDFLPGPAIARLVRTAVARADRVTVNSLAVARDLDPEGALGQRLSVISPGIELPDYDREWERSPEPEVLLLGTLMPWKRPDLALEAVARAAASVPGLRLTVAGAPMNAEGEQLLQALVRRAGQPDLEGRVTFAGELPDPREALGRAWCLLHCADREPFGSVVLQALASGRPVVAPAAGGPAEIVEESCGRLYPPGDADAAAAALVEILTTPGMVETLGAGGRARAGWFEAEEARERFAAVAADAVAEREARAGAGGAAGAAGAPRAPAAPAAPPAPAGPAAPPAPATPPASAGPAAPPAPATPPAPADPATPPAPAAPATPPAPAAPAAPLAPAAPAAPRKAPSAQVFDRTSLIAAHRERPLGHAVHQGAGMALVTVTHNSAAAVERLLRSVELHLPGANVIVVDSGSTDGSSTAARAAAPRATVIELAENVGFGRASNAGVALVEEPVCVLVNPDVELVDSSLANLGGDLLVPGAPARILAPAVLSPDGSRQDSAHLDPGSRLQLLRALVPAAALPAPLRTLVDPWRAQDSRRVGWAVGACLVAPTETLRLLGPFDERIFLFAEDMDLGLRAADAGVETVFRPDARVVHEDAHSTAVAFGGEPIELLERQRRAVIGERRGQEAARRDDRIWLLTYANRIVFKTLTRRSTSRERRQLAALRRVRDEPARIGEPSGS